MKKFLYTLIISSLTLWSCGGGAEGGAEGEEAGSTEATEAIKGTATDLTPHGLPFTITIPEGNGEEPEIMENSVGGIDIRKGMGYMVSINWGAGDLALVKSDLNGDILYKATILEEGPDFIVYKREIPDSGMEPEYHFIHVMKVGGDALEVQNMKDEVFSEEAIRKMLGSAKTLKQNVAS